MSYEDDSIVEDEDLNENYKRVFIDDDNDDNRLVGNKKARNEEDVEIKKLLQQKTESIIVC